MHRIPRVFKHSSNRTGSDSGSSSPSAKPKPRLDRRNAQKNIDYEFSPSSASASSSLSRYSSEESIRLRFLELYDGKTSFRIEGIDGEIEMICKTLGFSGIDDFSINPEEYEEMKARSFSSLPAASSRITEAFADRKMEVKGDGVDLVNQNTTEGDDKSVGSSDDISVINSKNREKTDCMDTNRANVIDTRLGDVNSSDSTSVRSNEPRGNGLKGARPPHLAPPPLMVLPVIDKESLAWDMFRPFTPNGGTQISRFGQGFCSDGDEEGLNSNVEDDRRRSGMMMGENCVLSASCSFSTNSNDDDSSSTTTELMLSISPNGRFRRVISEWQKGELLGRGSFGSVYEGIADCGFFFAVKEVSLLDQEGEGKQRIIQLEQEIALLSQFEHENIVQYYGTKKDESNLYIFLELVTKGSLLSLYQKYILRDSSVSAYTRQILLGLGYLHDKNVVHRDIKCANILVDTNGAVKLADFGLAKATKLNDVKSCKGTAFWMAPEVVRSRGYGLPADIWSLGCTVLEMLTRRFPYPDLECMAAVFRIGRGERPEIPDSLSSNARDFILKCLQVDPSMRPTASQLLDHPFVKQPLPPSSGFTSPHFFGRQI